MKFKYKRTSKNYDGKNPTSHQLTELLPLFVQRLKENRSKGSSEVIAMWNAMVDANIASMTKLTGFKEGILFVQVSSSSALAYLVQHHKKILIEKMQKKYPDLALKDIKFRVG